MTTDLFIELVVAVKKMRKKQKEYFESRKKVGSNRQLLEAAVRAEMDVDSLIWKYSKEFKLNEEEKIAEPEEGLF